VERHLAFWNYFTGLSWSLRQPFGAGGVGSTGGREWVDTHYARLAFTSATRMIRRLPSALAARVIVSSVTDTF
jgi:hypothetical protein